MMRKAFTLIELLVVIAIIAILAAILFPVFAQAKAAAKATASISNAKQQGTAIAMYEGDFDDVVPLTTAWNTGRDPVCFAGGTACPSTWVWLVQPYMKSGDLSADPLAPPMVTPATWPRAVAASLNAQYGYNYAHLNNWTGPGTAAPISATAPANPADTVMIASNYAKTEWGYPRAGTTGLAFQFTGGTDNGPLLNVVMDPPDCATIPAYCIGNWGQGSAWETTVLLTQDAHGRRTGGTSLRASEGAIVVFMDSHAKKLRAGSLAAGTNWNNNLNHTSLVVNAVEKYMWDIR